MFKHITSVSEPQEFTVTSGALRVTDPCYDIATWCSGQLDNVQNGKWQARAGFYADSSDKMHQQTYRDAMIAEYNAMHEMFVRSVEQSFINQGKPLPGNIDELNGSPWKRRIADFEKKCAEEDANDVGRVAYLHVYHQSQASMPRFDDLSQYEETGIDVGVDSGQAGFFDLALYPNRNEVRDEAFYDQVCDKSLNHSFGTIPFGAVSMAGYGDGSYQCYVFKKDGIVLEALIVFIDEFDLEDEEEE